jgi:uncharacterized DUF497 family protein
MSEATAETILQGIEGFEWDEQKAVSNRAKHGVDFDDATDVLYGSPLLYRSDRKNEERWVAVGALEQKIVAVIFTRRGNYLRIVSARQARDSEKRAYHQTTLGRPPEGQD